MRYHYAARAEFYCGVLAPCEFITQVRASVICDNFATVRDGAKDAVYLAEIVERRDDKSVIVNIKAR